MTPDRYRQHSAAPRVNGGPPVVVEAPGSVGPSGSLVIGRFLGTVMVTVHGELDVAAAKALTRTLRDLIEAGSFTVVVDLDDAAGIDRLGVEALAAVAHRIARRGGVPRLARPPGAVFDALVFAGLGSLVGPPFEQAPGPGPLRPAASRRTTSATPATVRSASAPRVQPADSDRVPRSEPGGRS